MFLLKYYTCKRVIVIESSYEKSVTSYSYLMKIQNTCCLIIVACFVRINTLGIKTIGFDACQDNSKELRKTWRSRVRRKQRWTYRLSKHLKTAAISRVGQQSPFFESPLCYTTEQRSGKLRRSSFAPKVSHRKVSSSQHVRAFAHENPATRTGWPRRCPGTLHSVLASMQRKLPYPQARARKLEHRKNCWNVMKECMSTKIGHERLGDKMQLIIRRGMLKAMLLVLAHYRIRCR